MNAGAAGGWKLLPTVQRRMILMLAGAVALANVAQPYPDLAPLQHGPTVALILFAPFALRRWPLSDRSVGCILIFLLLHTLGARWIYSYVPYDAWTKALTGIDLSRLLGATRNGYDRLVHISFGVLLTLPIMEIACRRGRLSMTWGLIFAFTAVGFCSALYEIFEWVLSVVAAGPTADHYNGQQGDLWDAQKDMACAQAGSLLTTILLILLRRRSRHNGGQADHR